MRRLRQSAALAAPAFLGLAAAALAAEGPSLTVEMVNGPDGFQTMRLDRAQVAPGPVTFRVHNLSTDMVHEFLVLRTTLVPAEFPMQQGESRVDEGKLGMIVELGDLEPGESGTMPLTLQPGHYVLFCNEPGHFAGGMHAELTVAN
jgi:uncharacterized cupredoxin-like copper-binding protein